MHIRGWAAFTPDSKNVVVTYGGEIWRVPVDKSAPAKIPFSAEVKLEMGPEVKFAYRVDTTSAFRAHQIRDIAPSPDGKRLAFSSLDRIYVVDLPNGTPTRISNGTVGEFGPVWSPDGKSIAFTTWNDAAGGTIVKATTTNGRTWTTAPLTGTGLFGDLAWSPAGDRIVAVRAAAREMQEAGAAFFGPTAADFVWLPATGGAVTPIMPTGGMGNPHFTSDPTRIYAYGREGLVSFRWDGTDLKVHLKVVGPLPPGAVGGSNSQMTLDAGMENTMAQQWVGGRAMRPVALEPGIPTHLDDPSEPTPPQPPLAALVIMAPKGDHQGARDGGHGFLHHHHSADRRHGANGIGGRSGVGSGAGAQAE